MSGHKWKLGFETATRRRAEQKLSRKRSKMHHNIRRLTKENRVWCVLQLKNKLWGFLWVWQHLQNRILDDEWTQSRIARKDGGARAARIWALEKNNRSKGVVTEKGKMKLEMSRWTCMLPALQVALDGLWEASTITGPEETLAHHRKPRET